MSGSGQPRSAPRPTPPPRTRRQPRGGAPARPARAPRGGACPCGARFFSTQGGGRVEDRLRGAVVLLEPEDPRTGKVLLEVEDVGDVRSSPRVDGLVLVSDHGEIARLSARGGAPARTVRGWCPGTRPRGGSGSARATRPASPPRPPSGGPPHAGAGRRSPGPPRRRGSPEISPCTCAVTPSAAWSSSSPLPPEFFRAEMRESSRRGGCSFSERSRARIACRTADIWSISS